MEISYISFSEKGGRMNNEDCRSVLNIDDERKMFIVCDGMGGHAFGEVASKTVCDSISEYWETHPDEKDGGSKVYRATKETQKRLDETSGIYQMGTTMVMMSINGQTATIAHTGDSRCYVIDLKGNIKYRTKDHIETGTPWGHPYINRAFFTHHPDQAIPEIKQIELQPYDRILLCTDGLYNTIDDNTLLHSLQCTKDVEDTANIYLSICHGKADDNYTAIIIEVV